MKKVKLVSSLTTVEFLQLCVKNEKVINTEMINSIKTDGIFEFCFFNGECIEVKNNDKLVSVKGCKDYFFKMFFGEVFFKVGGSEKEINSVYIQNYTEEDFGIFVNIKN